MQRYFVEPSMRQGDVFHLPKDDAHHMKNVMRMEVGGEILVLDGTGLYRCRLEALDKQAASARIEETLPIETELPIRVTIAHGLPKGDKIELVAQKATELGIHHLRIFEADRSVSKWDQKKVPKKLERLEKIVKEAAEQSYRAHLPTVDFVTYDEVLQDASNYTACLVAYEESAKQGEASVLATTLAGLQEGDSLLVVIGPEGGFAEAEIARLAEAGFKQAALGRRILRTETAPFYVLSAVSYHFELKG